MQLRLSDEQFVERVRRGQCARRPLGLIGLVIGIAGFLVFAWHAASLYQQSKVAFDDMVRGEPREVREATDAARDLNMFVLGFASAVGLAATAVLTATGFVLLTTR